MLLSEKLYKKYNKTKNPFIIETILQYYLIQKNIRNIAQIYINKLVFEEEFNQLIKFLKKYKISYIKNDNKIIIYDKYDINNINKSFGKKYAKQLGIFYKCASNNFSKNNVRVVIQLNSNNGDEIELYAQMCNVNQIKKYFNSIYDFYNEIKNILELLDKNIFCIIKIYNID
jgi:hypothetical protein